MSGQCTPEGDGDVGLQWLVFAGEITRLLDADGLTTAGLDWLRTELLLGAWQRDALPAGTWRERHVELLERVDAAIAGDDEVRLAHLRQVDGLSVPDTLGDFA